MAYSINPNMILLAREARGLTQTELADKLQLHKANISRLENGDTLVNDKILIAIAEVTHFPPQFFMQPGGPIPVNLSYRKRQQVPAKITSAIDAQVNIIRRHVQFITRALQQQKPVLPLYEVTETQSPAQIASLLRKKWSITVPLIDNISDLLEQKGIIICSFDFDTERVDSRTMLTDDEYPIIFINSSALADKQRFSLAFELGHLIMHTFCIVPHQRDISHEANLFAAEFLMPEKDIRKDLKDTITLPLLGELKRKWKISMIALLYRADDLGLLTPNQKRYLLQQFNEQKIRRREPPQLDAQKEEPRLMRSLLTGFMSKTKLDTSQLCTLLAIEMNDYLKYYPS
jgi:Zn-dependent peptidase ImmA (M78 family)/DNA-binding XRE family transcriptional regulator